MIVCMQSVNMLCFLSEWNIYHSTGMLCINMIKFVCVSSSCVFYTYENEYIVNSLCHSSSVCRRGFCKYFHFLMKCLWVSLVEMELRLGGLELSHQATQTTGSTRVKYTKSIRKWKWCENFPIAGTINIITFRPFWFTSLSRLIEV